MQRPWGGCLLVTFKGRSEPEKEGGIKVREGVVGGITGGFVAHIESLGFYSKR